MKKVFIFAAVLTLFVFFSYVSAADKYQWKLVETKDGCELYTSMVSGKDYIAARTTCLIPARIETIGVVLRDIEGYPKWMEDCRETKILKVPDPENDGFIFWFRQYIPFHKDRDIVLKNRLEMNLKNGQDIIYAELTDEISYDAGKEYVRMPSFSSEWTLEWVDREHTRVTFMVDPDLGEGLPKFLANPLIKTTPFKSLKRMMKVVKDPRYIEEGKNSRYYNLVEKAIQAGYVK